MKTEATIRKRYSQIVMSANRQMTKYNCNAWREEIKTLEWVLNIKHPTNKSEDRK